MDDDPYIYSDKDGTICLSGKKVSAYGFEEKDIKDSARRITPSYQTTSEAYRKTKNDKLEYAENDEVCLNKNKIKVYGEAFGEILPYIYYI